MIKLAALLLAAFVFTAIHASAAEFKLADGGSIKGDPVDFNEAGMVLKLEDGTFAPRVAWFKFPPEVLKELVTNPKAKRFVEPLIEVPVEEKQKAKREKNCSICSAGAGRRVRSEGSGARSRVGNRKPTPPPLRPS